MKYQNVQFIAYRVDTFPKQVKGALKGFEIADMKTLLPVYEHLQQYTGIGDDTKDINSRCSLMEDAIHRAYESAFVQKSQSCLKLFMAPEFYFRGVRGAYSLDTYLTIVERLRSFVKPDIFKDWLFVFGSCIAFSEKHEIDRPKGPSIAGDRGLEVYNIVFIQKGNTDERGSCVVMKEFKSGIDFMSKRWEQKSTTGQVTGILVESMGDVGEKLMHEDVQHLKAGKGKDPNRGMGKEAQRLRYDGLGMFSVDDIQFGVEVCLDHAMRRLWRSHPGPGQNRVQIQLIPSAGMSIKSESVVAMPDGYVFNCDGGGGGYHAWIAQVQKHVDPATGYLGLSSIALAHSGGTSGFVQSFQAHGGKSGLSSADFNQCFLPGNLPMIHVANTLKIPPAQTVKTSKEVENPHWVPDDASRACHACKKTFGVTVRRHHCRICGRIFCDTCSSKRAKAPNYGYRTDVRMCEECASGKNRFLYY
jgi:hypothetical protein